MGRLYASSGGGRLPRGENPEIEIRRLCRDSGKSISIAESCTGGLISNMITNVPGSSEYFRGGVVAYSNEAKERLLSVQKRHLQKFGAVSRRVAEAMAVGVRKGFGSDFGLSVTGIAGPMGGTAEKPVGLVYVGLDDGKITQVFSFHFRGTRLQIKKQTAKSALRILAENLRCAQKR